ncbi:MAG TPA: hypothetical protein VGD91_05220, partial [Trebonia sp.]
EAREAADDRALAAARDSLPARRIIEVFGGFLAVPAGSVIAQSTTLDGSVGKLRTLGDGS